MRVEWERGREREGGRERGREGEEGSEGGRDREGERWGWDERGKPTNRLSRPYDTHASVHEAACKEKTTPLEFKWYH